MGERVFGDAQQLVGSVINNSYWHSGSVVPHPAILNDANIQFYDVAILNAPLAADSVHDFVIKGNTNVAGKNAVAESITKKRTFHVCAAHEVRCCFVHLFCGNSGTNQVTNTVENVAGGAASLPHLLNFPGVLDRNHRLFSISRAISPKTASRSRLPLIRCSID